MRVLWQLERFVLKSLSFKQITLKIFGLSKLKCTFAALESATLPIEQRTRAELFVYMRMEYTNPPLDTALQSIHFLFPCPFTFIFCFNCIKLISYDTFHCPYRRSLFNIDIIHSAENGKSILRAVLKMSFADNLTFHF